MKTYIQKQVSFLMPARLIYIGSPDGAPKVEAAPPQPQVSPEAQARNAIRQKAMDALANKNSNLSPEDRQNIQQLLDASTRNDVQNKTNDAILVTQSLHAELMRAGVRFNAQEQSVLEKGKILGSERQRLDDLGKGLEAVQKAFYSARDAAKDYINSLNTTADSLRQMYGQFQTNLIAIRNLEAGGNQNPARLDELKAANAQLLTQYAELKATYDKNVQTYKTSLRAKAEISLQALNDHENKINQLKKDFGELAGPSTDPNHLKTYLPDPATLPDLGPAVPAAAPAPAPTPAPAPGLGPIAQASPPTPNTRMR